MRWPGEGLRDREKEREREESEQALERGRERDVQYTIRLWLNLVYLSILATMVEYFMQVPSKYIYSLIRQQLNYKYNEGNRFLP